MDGYQLEHAGNSESALDNILAREFEESLLKFSSLLCILNDKKLSSIAVFSLIMKDLNIRSAFKQLTQIDNDRILVLKFLHYYPNLCKSKVVKRLVYDNVD